MSRVNWSILPIAKRLEIVCSCGWRNADGTPTDHGRAIASLAWSKISYPVRLRIGLEMGWFREGWL